MSGFEWLNIMDDSVLFPLVMLQQIRIYSASHYAVICGRRDCAISLHISH